MSRIAVAATAPFGADVLERLAAKHDVVQLLTRPDAPRGRGQKLAPSPAKEAAERLGIPVVHERDALAADTVVVCAYGLLIPESLLSRALWLNVHPSLLPRWRGAAPVERAIMAGDAQTGVTIHRTTKELDAGPIAAQEAFEIGPEDDAGVVYARAAEVAARLLDGVLDDPTFTPQPDRGVTYAEKITPGRSRARSVTAGDRAREPRPRAVPAHRSARWAISSSGRRASTAARSSRSKSSPPAAGAWTTRRISVADVSPARRAAYEVLLRVFEQEAYADRAFRTAAKGLDERERGFAQRLAYGAVQRVRTLDHAIETLGKRPVRKLDPPVRAALRLGAYQLGYTETAPHAAANESVELVRRARLERAVPFTNAVMRRLTAGMRGLLDALPDGPLKESYPDWIAEIWTRDFGADEALALMRAQNEPLETVVRLVRGDPPGEPTDIPGAYRVERVDDLAVAEGRIWPQSRGSQLAGLVVGSQEGERVLDLCAAPGGKATQQRGEVTAVEIDPHRASELRENAARLGATNVHVVEADATALPPELTGLRPGARGCALLRPRCPRSASRPALARASAARAPARPPAIGRRARPAGRDDRLLGLHDERGRERGHRRGERAHRLAARGGVAAVRAPQAAGIPPDASV